MVAQREIRLGARVWMRYSPQAVGFLSVVLGVIGISLPVLSTTSLLFLTAACFMRSPPRFYHWPVSHPRLSPRIRDYLDGEGIPLKGKVYAIGPTQVSTTLSCHLARHLWAQGFMLTSVVLVSIYILHQKTRPPHDA